MALRKDGSTVMVQASMHRDVARKIDALAERMGIKPSAVVAFAINTLADEYGVTVKDVVDPRQTSLFGEGEAA